MCQRCDVVMPECGDAMSNRCRLRMLMRFLRVLQGLPRMLLPRKVILLPRLLGNPMGMRRLIV
jgi:hypothetical protein